MDKKTNGNGTEYLAYCEPDSEEVVYFGAGDVIAAEFDYIRKRRGLPGDTDMHGQNLSGLALSGGGIRSASFSLGVMQALAFNNWLAKIDYLSTVSGGGYIGSSLTWALNDADYNFGLTDETFPFASFPMSGGPRDKEKRSSLESLVQSRSEKSSKWSGRLLNFLRQNAKYLTPGNGLNLFALVWIALRGAALGLLIYGSLITLGFLAAFQGGWLREVCVLTFLPEVLRQNWILFAAVLGLAICLLTVPIYSFITYLYHFPRDQKAAYLFRRKYERTAGTLLPVLLGLFLFGIIPPAHDYVVNRGAPAGKTGQFTVSGSVLKDGTFSFKGTMDTVAGTEKKAPPPADSGATFDEGGEKPEKETFWTYLGKEFNALGTGLGTIIVGLFSGIMAFFKTKSTKPGKLPLGLLVGIGVAALFFGIVLSAYTVAYAVVETTGGEPNATWTVILTGLAVTLFFAFFTNLNHITIHRFYRDRLMETFMPDIARVLKGEYAEANSSGRANTEPLHGMTRGPYHIVNTNVVLANSHKPKFRGRGGDNFILTPFYCGSMATGWQWTESYMKGTMTLASAMAISGAALNPSAGCGGEGVTRSPALSALMGLLNFRLGYWVPNPKNWQKLSGGLRNPNFLLPGLWEVLLRNRLKEDGVFLQLSDGGHFENLALYELVRRKLKLIIVCDGGADPKFTFSDLANATEKVRADFGALIMIDNEKLKDLIPPAAKDKDKEEIRCATKPYLVAPIMYADNTEGTLIYLTTTFFKGVSADLYGYKKAHPAFPDESTGDQFFDEKQIEAYRELGFQAAWTMMNDLKDDNEDDQAQLAGEEEGAQA